MLNIIRKDIDSMRGVSSSKVRVANAADLTVLTRSVWPLVYGAVQEMVVGIIGTHNAVCYLLYDH